MKKKINKVLSLLLAVVLVATLLQVPVMADVYTFNNFRFVLEAGNAEIIGYNGEPSGELNIPSTVKSDENTYSVTRIGDKAFYECSGFTGKLTIPSSVTSIGDYAFYECSGLTGDITIPDSITKIGFGSFSNCSGFKGSLTIPDGITSIGAEAFYKCSGLTGDLTIPSSVTYIGDSAFGGCKLKIKVDENNEYYSDQNYNGIFDKTGSTLYYGYNDTTISDVVTTIENGAFKGCEDLISIEIPDSVTCIDEYAFMDCTSLEDIKMPNQLQTLGRNVFENCTSLKSAIVSSNYIGNYLFCGCSNLKNVEVYCSAKPSSGGNDYDLFDNKTRVDRIVNGTGYNFHIGWHRPLVDDYGEYWWAHVPNYGRKGYWIDEDTGEGYRGGNLLGHGSTVVWQHEHDLIKHDGVEATESTEGNIEYWECTECHKYFSDEEGKTEILKENIIIPAKGTESDEDKDKTDPESSHIHNLIKHDRVEATETVSGNIEYWECSECHKLFSDENGENEITLEDTIIPKKAKTTEEPKVTISDNKPMDVKTENVEGGYEVTYAHEIPFAGKGKLTVESFGEKFIISHGNAIYKVKKIKVNKKKKRIQITKLDNAPKDVEKAVKKATKGNKGIPYTQNPYYVKDTDSVKAKFKKNGLLSSVKVTINGKDYKAKKSEFEYAENTKTIQFKGDNLAGSWTVK